jgi:hypothetical protein
MGSEQVKHSPLVETVLGPKYEDAEESVTDWDGAVRLRCTCGWTDSRIYASTNSLPGAWRAHVTADMFGIGHRGRQSGPATS